MGKNRGFAVRGELRLKNARLINERLALNMDQKEFAKLVKIPYQSYNAYENLREYPIKKHVDILCEFCCCDKDELFPPELERYAENKDTRVLVSTTIIEPSRLLGMNRKEVLSLPSGDETDDSADTVLIKRHIEEVLDCLSPRDARIIRFSYGFDGELPKSLVEIADILGVTGQRVRQLRERAMFRIRAMLFERHPKWAKEAYGIHLGETPLNSDEMRNWDVLSRRLHIHRTADVHELIHSSSK